MRHVNTRMVDPIWCHSSCVRCGVQQPAHTCRLLHPACCVGPQEQLHTPGKPGVGLLAFSASSEVSVVTVAGVESWGSVVSLIISHGTFEEAEQRRIAQRGNRVANKASFGRGFATFDVCFAFPRVFPWDGGASQSNPRFVVRPPYRAQNCAHNRA